MSSGSVDYQTQLRGFLQITDDDIKQIDMQEIAAILELECPKLIEVDANDKLNKKFNKSMLITVGLAKKYRLPILTWFSDIYNRLSIDHSKDPTNTSPMSPAEFCDTYYFINNLKHSNKKLYDIFKHVIPTLKRRGIFTYPDLGTPKLHLYHDNINDYIDITQQLYTLIKSRHKDNNIPCPTQLDVWILPRDVQHQNTGDEKIIDSSSGDDTDPEYPVHVQGFFKKGLSKLMNRFGNNQKQNDPNTVGNNQKNKPKQPQQHNKDEVFSKNIGKILSANYKKGIITELITDEIQLDNNGQITGDSWYHRLRNIIKLKALKRYILIIDRRILSQNNNKIFIYFYRAPQENSSISKDYNYFMRCRNVVNSAKVILPRHPKLKNPKKRLSDIGMLNACAGYSFILSFHINSIDQTSVYWASNGEAFRMFTTDMRDIWPAYFTCTDTISQQRQIPKLAHYLSFELHDIPFNKFFKATTKYSKVYNDDEYHYMLRQKDTILQILELMETEWYRESKFTQQQIDEMFGTECSIEDVIDDLDNGLDNSEILDYLRGNHVNQSDVIEFGIKLKNTLQQWSRILLINGYIKQNKIPLEIGYTIYKFYC